MSIIRARTRTTLNHPNVRALIIRAIEATQYPDVTPELLYHEMARRCYEPEMGIFLGFGVRHMPRAAAGILLPVSSLMAAPQVFLAYNEGSPALFREMASHARKWLLSAGYNKAFALNLRRSDAVFERGLRHFGKPERKGSVIEFDLS